MNIEKKSGNGLASAHRIRPFIYVLAGILLLLLWAFLTRPDSGGTGGGNGNGSGGNAAFGSGSGNGPSGDGPGAGKNGDGADEKTQQSSENAPNAAVPTEPDAESAAENAPEPDDAPSAETMEEVKKLLKTQHEVLTTPQITPAAANPSVRKTEGRQGFYGMKVSSEENVLFLVDVSGSMGQGSSEMPGKTRLDILKMELKKCIPNIGKSGGMSYRQKGGCIIIPFSDGTTKFPENDALCLYRMRRNVQDAEKFIDEKIVIDGGTYMRQAWERALEQAKKFKIDTIYFLTDGESSDGFGGDELLKMLKKSVDDRVKVNCVAIGVNQPFMKDVAEKRHGKYVFLP